MRNDLFRMTDTLFNSVYQGDLMKLAGYPPYNIAKVDEDKYVIEMAVAGFGKQNLSIETSNGVLTISGMTNLEDDDTDNTYSYIYKGIAERAFKRQFKLQDSVEIKNAELINGLLKIWLENIIPEEKKPKKIEINTGEAEITKPAISEEKKDKKNV